MFRNPYADGLIVLVIVLLFFGPKRLPTLGRSLGQGLREFKDSITGGGGTDAGERASLGSGDPTSDAPAQSRAGDGGAMASSAAEPAAPEVEEPVSSGGPATPPAEPR